GRRPRAGDRPRRPARRRRGAGVGAERWRRTELGGRREGPHPVGVAPDRLGDRGAGRGGEGPGDAPEHPPQPAQETRHLPPRSRRVTPPRPVVAPRDFVGRAVVHHARSTDAYPKPTLPTHSLPTA